MTTTAWFPMLLLSRNTKVACHQTGLTDKSLHFTKNCKRSNVIKTLPLKTIALIHNFCYQIRCNYVGSKKTFKTITHTDNMMDSRRRLHPGPDDSIIRHHSRIPRQVSSRRRLAATGPLAMPVANVECVHLLEKPSHGKHAHLELAFSSYCSDSS